MKKITNILWRGKVTVLAVVVALILVAAAPALAGKKPPAFLLNKINTVTKVSGLVGSLAAGAVFKADNNGGGPAASFEANTGVAPLTVNADSGTATNLSADKLDGKDSTELLGANDKAADADELDGQDSTEFLGATQKAADSDLLDGNDSSAFLGANQKAADADKLDGQDSTAFLGANGKAADADKLDGFDSTKLPGQITSIGAFDGPAGISIPVDAANYVFAGPTTTVTVAANQRLVGSAEAPLGLSSGSAQTLDYGLCYQPAGGGPTITNFVGANYSLGTITTTRASYPASASVALLPGTFKVGFCVRNSGPQPISNNDWVNGWVQVVNAPPIAATSSEETQERK